MHGQIHRLTNALQAEAERWAKIETSANPRRTPDAMVMRYGPGIAADEGVEPFLLGFRLRVYDPPRGYTDYTITIVEETDR